MTAKHYYLTISIVLSPDAGTFFFFAESPNTETETQNGKKNAEKLEWKREWDRKEEERWCDLKV